MNKIWLLTMASLWIKSVKSLSPSNKQVMVGTYNLWQTCSNSNFTHWTWFRTRNFWINFRGFYNDCHSAVTAQCILCSQLDWLWQCNGTTSYTIIDRENMLTSQPRSILLPTTMNGNPSTCLGAAWTKNCSCQFSSDLKEFGDMTS